MDTKLFLNKMDHFHIAYIYPIHIIPSIKAQNKLQCKSIPLCQTGLSMAWQGKVGWHGIGYTVSNWLTLQVTYFGHTDKYILCSNLLYDIPQLAAVLVDFSHYNTSAFSLSTWAIKSVCACFDKLTLALSSLY